MAQLYLLINFLHIFVKVSWNICMQCYYVTAEIGDFLDDEYLDHTYLVDMQLIPGQTDEQTIKLMEHHKELV